MKMEDSRNSSATKKKLKKEQGAMEEEEEERFSLKKRQKKLKKQPQSSSEQEDEISVKKKPRVIASVGRSSQQTRTKQYRENSLDRKAAESNNEEEEERKPRQKKRKKKQKSKGTTAFNDRTEDPHLENGLHAEGPVKSVDISFRLLVPSKEMGKVIGKQGYRIQQLREEIGAHIKIGDAVMDLEERVIWITSKEDNLASESAAERAVLSVATHLIRPENEDQEFAKIRLLAVQSQAKIVSKERNMLERISDETGAVVRIFSKDEFPLHAFASERDMLVQVEGKTFEVQQALKLVVARLRESLQQARNVEQFKVKTESGPFKTAVQIHIPARHIGKLIGKEGSTLRQIKEQCRVPIEVHDDIEHGGQGKIAHLKGGLAQVTMAQTLLQSFLASKHKAK